MQGAPHYVRQSPASGPVGTDLQRNILLAAMQANSGLSTALGRRDGRLPRQVRSERRSGAASVCAGAAGNLDRLQRRDDFGAARLEPWRQQHLFAEVFRRFVDRTADVAGRDFAEDPPRRAAIDRMEIIAVLDLRDVGIAETFEMRLDDCLLLFGRHGEGDVMDEALREGPRALLALGFMMKVDGLLSAALVDRKADEWP